MLLPEWWPDWTGDVCVIVASGPSASDAKLGIANGSAKFISVNSSWRLAPWSDVLYACDHAWWSGANGCSEFAGLKLTIDKRASDVDGWRVNLVGCNKKDDRAVLDGTNVVGWGGNSGFHALQLAVQFGCTKVLLVGFDLTISNGLHWHGPHENGMHNPCARHVERWRRVIDAAATPIGERGVRVINCSTQSALRRYQTMRFEDALLA